MAEISLSAGAVGVRGVGVFARLRFAVAIVAGRAARLLVRRIRGRGGSAFPGLVANTCAPDLLVHALNSFDGGLIVVSGSSGKSTTTRMLAMVLEAHGLTVFSNPSTANIRQGIMSALLDEVRLTGNARTQIAVIEMDEAHAALLARDVTPYTVVLTNVMVDQIDRFHEPTGVADMLAKVAERPVGNLVTNGDDALLEAIADRVGDGRRVWRFGVAGDVLDQVPRGLGYFHTAATRIMTGTIVEAVDGARATIAHGAERVEVDLPARGTHYAVDAAAAIAAAAAVLGDAFDLGVAAAAISAVPPVFGRGELVTVNGKLVEFVLVQNPASLQLNVDQLPDNLEQVVVAMGSDVRDSSYLWPVDTSSITGVFAVTGSIAEEVALQLAYWGVDVGRVDSDLPTVLNDFLALPDPTTGVKTIVFSADSMRRTRAHLGLS